ncbi:hypothetical protein BDZ90DRAFT_231015 [Jaminaea rosea]|uniref:Polycystin cation channel PKD1/PKD2 domain-containing protein n=1 Tax=Jaminaea rosea TaxID=1569628 RepID=A0A316UUV6_9BASI|nr:hypothetical protein BDZ90DRAFT_231015 [Jaminaea rosea]PWN29012.1 hypothetical protein BDZ90DRAFT_231015 [Jaminaea rosea]
MTRASAAGAASNHNHGRAPSGSLGHGHLEAQQPSRLFEEVRVAILEAREEQTQRQAEVNGDDDGEGGDGEASRLMATIETTPVYPLLQLIRGDVRLTIDTGLTWEELTGHELNFAVVRPLARKYSKLHSPAILYAFLVTRIYFLREADRDLAYQSVNQARASLCEILAIKLLRTFASDGLDLVTALSAPFWPFAGADEDVMSNVHRRGYAEKDPLNESTSTLQLAIYSTAKKFIATPLVQKCVDGIYSGKVVLGNSSAAGHAIIDDSYKKRPVCFYDPATAPFLDHRRLRVPRVRSWLEAANFVAILAAYIVCLGSEGTHEWTAAETIFIIWLIGLAIDELAQVKEHGWSVYVGSLFNVLDSVFCVIGFTWFGIRLAGLITGKAEHTEFAFNVLSLGAILLCPRMASLLVSDNVLLLALRAMVVEFSYFLGLALVFFSGFLWTFWSLSDSSKWTPATIGWLMLRFTFGNTISLEQAQEFSPTFGPWLVVAFTILAQTLLLTILISLLSATFSRVAAHAQEESLFQHSYSTLQGVSSEALFSYFPPLNILCLLIVLPATFFCSPRWVHKVNVFIIRLTHLPILLTIRLVERHDYWTRGVELAAAETKKGLRGHLIERLTTKRRTQFDIIEVAFSEIVAEGEERGDRGRDGSTAAKDSNLSSYDSQYQRRQTQAQDQQQQTSQDSGPKDTPRDHRQLERVVTTDSVKSNRSYPDSPGATIRRARDAFAAVSGKGGNGGRVVIVNAGNGGSGGGGGGQPSGVDLIRQDTFASLFSPSRPQRKGGIRRARTQSPSMRPPQEEGEEDGEGDEDKPAKRRGLWSKRKAAKQAEAGAEADTSASSQRRKEQLNLDDSVERKDYAENEEREDDGDEEASDDDDGNEAGSVGSEDEDSGPSNAAWGDVMLRFLERLDEQAQTTDRIEEMLNRIVASKEGGELSDEKPGDQAGEGGK